MHKQKLLSGILSKITGTLTDNLKDWINLVFKWVLI